MTGHHLLVLRHAAASGAARIPDAERPLTGDGVQDAGRVGTELVRIGAVPDRVVCSTARRARETWDAVSACLPAQPPVELDARIYANDPDLLFDLVRETTDDVSRLLIVGHNPAAYRLVLDLTRQQEPATGFPAASLAMVRVPGEWADVVPGGGEVAAWWTPGDPTAEAHAP